MTTRNNETWLDDIQLIAAGECEVDLGNGVIALIVSMSGSTPGFRLYDAIWWIDGIRHSERLRECELMTETTRYLNNTTKKLGTSCHGCYFHQPHSVLTCGSPEQCLAGNRWVAHGL